MGRAMVWTQKLFLENAEGEAVCTTCETIIGRGSTKKYRTNRSNLVSHYQRHHKDEYSKARKAEQAMQDQKARGNQGTLDNAFSRSREERLKEGITDFVILDQQPLNVVAATSYKRMLCSAARKDDLKVPDRRVLRTDIMDKAESAINALKNDVLKGRTVAATSYIWTANTGVLYISLTDQWIEPTAKQWTLRQATVGCEKFDG
ncbi:unnamed protein product, partial [Discosporangium mesarthrocarpum]